MQQDNRKYRLLKDLPETEKGSIFIWNDELGAYVWNEGTYQTESGKTCVPAFKRNTIENNPDWFELIQDIPDWEILSFKLSDAVFIKGQDGFFRCNWWYNPHDKWSAEEFLSNPKGYKINAVKRLSDNTTFSLGDKLETYFNEPIQKIEIDDKFHLGLGFIMEHGACAISSAIKLPIPSTPAPLKEGKPYISFDTYDIHLTKEQLDGMMENVWAQARMLAIDMPITGYLGTGLKYNTFNDYRVTLPENSPTPPKEEKVQITIIDRGIGKDYYLPDGTKLCEWSSYERMFDFYQQVCSEKFDKKYTEDELLEAEQKAFYSGQEVDFTKESLGRIEYRDGDCGEFYPNKYPTFTDYKNKNKTE